MTISFLMNKAIIDNNIASYAELYKNPREHLSFEVLSKTLIFRRLAREWIFRGSKVLEIGFGSGNLIPTILALGGDYCGMEISKSAIQSAVSRFGSRIAVTEMSPDELIIKDGPYAVIVMSHVLEHMPDDNHVLSKVYENLQKGGVLIAGVPTGTIAQSDSLHYRHYTVDDLKALADRHGFSVQRMLTFRRVKSIDRLLSVRNTEAFRSTQTAAKAGRASMVYLAYSYVLSPLLSWIYARGVGRGQENEIWSVMRKQPSGAEQDVADSV